MDPGRERAFALFVDEQSVFFVSDVVGYPADTERTDRNAEFDARSYTESTLAADDFYCFAGWSQQFERVRALVEIENCSHRSRNPRRMLKLHHYIELNRPRATHRA